MDELRAVDFIQMDARCRVEVYLLLRWPHLGSKNYKKSSKCSDSRWPMKFVQIFHSINSSERISVNKSLVSFDEMTHIDRIICTPHIHTFYYRYATYIPSTTDMPHTCPRRDKVEGYPPFRLLSKIHRSTAYSPILKTIHLIKGML